MHYLYRITDTLNNKIYIGQTNKPANRWSQHKYFSTQENPVQYISRAMKKYGAANFIYEVIAVCLTQNDANSIEAQLIFQYDSCNKEKGYNIEEGGNNSPMSEETKEKMRAVAAARPENYYEYMKGNKHAEGVEHTEEWKEMMRNREHSEEEKLKRSESLKASYAAGERTSYFRENEPWNKGIPMTEEQKEILRQVNLGKKHSPETIEKMSGKIPWNKGLPAEQQSRFGAVLTEDHKKALVEGNKKKRHLTDEQVAAIKADFAADSSRGAQTRLAKKYGVRQQMINKLLNGKSYN